MKRIKNLLDENEKISSFKDEKEFIEFVQLIVKENGDEKEFIIENMGQAENYIRVYCDNLELVD